MQRSISMQQEYVCHKALNSILDEPLSTKDLDSVSFIVGAKTGALSIRKGGSAARYIPAAVLVDFDLEAWEIAEYLCDNGATQCNTGWIPNNANTQHVPDSDYIKVGECFLPKPKRNLMWMQDEKGFWFQADLGPEVEWKPDSEGFWKLVAKCPEGGTPPVPKKGEWTQGSKGFWNKVWTPMTVAN